MREIIYGLFPFVHSAYEKPSSLPSAMTSYMQSSEGVQQGDPLGPLLLCLAVSLKSEFRILKLDVTSLGGRMEDVLRDFWLVENSTSALGLQLNHSKSDLICVDPAIKKTTSMLLKVPGLLEVSRKLLHAWAHPFEVWRGLERLSRIRLLSFSSWVPGSASSILMMPFNYFVIPSQFPKSCISCAQCPASSHQHF